MPLPDPLGWHCELEIIKPLLTGEALRVIVSSPWFFFPKLELMNIKDWKLIHSGSSLNTTSEVHHLHANWMQSYSACTSCEVMLLLQWFLYIKHRVFQREIHMLFFEQFKSQTTLNPVSEWGVLQPGWIKIFVEFWKLMRRRQTSNPMRWSVLTSSIRAKFFRWEENVPVVSMCFRRRGIKWMMMASWN